MLLSVDNKGAYMSCVYFEKIGHTAETYFDKHDYPPKPKHNGNTTTIFVENIKTLKSNDVSS